ncbi:unnamed protein product [Malus baccata var. baccata]
MASPYCHHFDLNVVEDANMSPQDNIWHSSFLSANGPFTIGDFVMRNNITATMMVRNLLTPKDNGILSKWSDELVVQLPLAFSIQCADSVSNMGQRLLVRTRQVESLMAEVASLRQEIRGLKFENRELHMLTNNYSTSIKRKFDQLQESKSRIQSDHQKFVALFQRHQLPSSSGVLPSTNAPNNQPLMPFLPRVTPSTEASHDPSSVPPPFGVLPSTEVSYEQPL